MNVEKTWNHVKHRHYNNRERLALHILDWHGGQYTDLYALGSSWLAGHEVTLPTVDGALDEIDGIIAKRVPHPECVMDSNIRELTELKSKITRMNARSKGL